MDLDQINHIGAVTDNKLAQLAIESLVDSASNAYDVHVEAGFLYDRKGYPTVDPILGPRNESYGSESDDLVIRVTMRVPKYASGISNMLDRAHELKAEAVEERRAAIKQQIDKLNSELDDL